MRLAPKGIETVLVEQRPRRCDAAKPIPHESALKEARRNHVVDLAHGCRPSNAGGVNPARRHPSDKLDRLEGATAWLAVVLNGGGKPRLAAGAALQVCRWLRLSKPAKQIVHFEHDFSTSGRSAPAISTPVNTRMAVTASASTCHPHTGFPNGIAILPEAFRQVTSRQRGCRGWRMLSLSRFHKQPWC